VKIAVSGSDWARRLVCWPRCSSSSAAGRPPPAAMDRKMQEAIFDRWSEEQQVHEVFRLSNLNSRLTLSVFFARRCGRDSTPASSNGRPIADRISGLIRAIELGLDTEEEKRLLAAVEAARKPYAESYQQALAKLVDGHQRDEARKMMAALPCHGSPFITPLGKPLPNVKLTRSSGPSSRANQLCGGSAEACCSWSFWAVLITVAIAGYVTFRVTREVAERVRGGRSLRQFQRPVGTTGPAATRRNWEKPTRSCKRKSPTASGRRRR